MSNDASCVHMNFAGSVLHSLPCLTFDSWIADPLCRLTKDEQQVKNRVKRGNYFKNIYSEGTAESTNTITRTNSHAYAALKEREREMKSWRSKWKVCIESRAGIYFPASLRLSAVSFGSQEMRQAIMWLWKEINEKFWNVTHEHMWPALLTTVHPADRIVSHLLLPIGSRSCIDKQCDPFWWNCCRSLVNGVALRHDHMSVFLHIKWAGKKSKHLNRRHMSHNTAVWSLIFFRSSDVCFGFRYSERMVCCCLLLVSEARKETEQK